MYFIGNVRHFLSKEGFAPSAINEIVEKLESKVVNNTTGDSGFVTSSSVRDVLDHDTFAKFTKDFNEDPKHLEIVTQLGQIPKT